MIRWIVFSTLGAGLFWGLYSLLMRRDRWLRLNRYFLMAGLLFSLVYPLVRLPEVAVPMSDTEEPALLPALTVDGAAAEAATDPVPESGTNDDSPLRWAALLYLTGVAVTLAMLVAGLVRVTRRLRRLPFERRGRLRLALTDDETAPWSFFRHVVVGTRGLSDEEVHAILVHESTHARQLHSLDVLAMRLMCCAAWFNPFAWLMLRELRAVHEYLADEAVLASTGSGRYFGLLYRQATGTGYGHITNNFQSINIKNRIVMMNKTKTRYGAWKVLALLPVVAVLMAFGCRPTGDVKSSDILGNTLMTIDYHKEGGRRLPFGGLGYNHVKATFVETTPYFRGTVTCSGEGVESSYGAWELAGPAIGTTKGVMEGYALSRQEKRIIQAVDRKLRGGQAEGTIVRRVRGAAEEGKVDLALVASWRNGNRQGDADITLTVKELMAIPDGNYNCHHYMDYFEGGRLVSREWLEDGPMIVPADELAKVPVIIGTRDEVAQALKDLQDEYLYVDLQQLRANDAQPENRGVDLWELSYTNDVRTWLARWMIHDGTLTRPAEFEGGTAALAAWLQAHIQYPESARREGVTGTVFVRFVVEKDGSVSRAEVVHELSGSKTALLADEALRVVKAMPRWRPATFMNQPTDSYFYLPISFKL